MLVFPDHIPAAVTHLMNYTDLGGRLREDGADGLGKAVEVISDGDQEIFHSTGLHIG